MSEPFRESYFNAIQVLSDENESLCRENKRRTGRVIEKCIESSGGQALVAAYCISRGVEENSALAVLCGLVWATAALHNCFQAWMLWRDW